MVSKIPSFIVKAVKLDINSANNNLDDFISNPSCIYDFFDKRNAHMATKRPYQFLCKINYSYYCFLLSMHYDLYLTYHI